MPINWLALDIGGLHLKVADGRDFAVSEPFPLWQKPGQLAAALRTLIAGGPESDHLAATMTGDLADCFSTRTEGVRFILNAFSEAADRRHTRVYLSNGNLVTPQVALRQPLLAAGSNWHALARFAGRYAKRGPGLLFDVGSATCDIVPLMDGQPMPIGRTDTERLIHGEFVYTGVERSPVCALADSVPWRGQQCATVHEVFATAWDVYLTLGELPEEPRSTHTADRRPATKDAARDRLARSICADRDVFDASDALAVARVLADKQVDRIATALKKVLARLPGPPDTVVASGRGEFVARRVIKKIDLNTKVVSLAKELGPDVSRCAAAHALAVLAREG